MASTAAAGLACCFCCGVAEYVRRHVQLEHSAEQRYKALSSTDVADDDDDDDYDDLAGTSAEIQAAEEAERDAERYADLLDFPPAGADAPVATPLTNAAAGRPSAAHSASRSCATAAAHAVTPAHRSRAHSRMLLRHQATRRLRMRTGPARPRACCVQQSRATSSPHARPA